MDSEYAAQHPVLEELEAAERALWIERHGTETPLDSALLFAEIERQVNSSNDEEDKAKYETLRSLREKQAEMADLLDTPQARSEWQFPEVPSSSVDLNINVSRILSKV